MRTEVTLGSIRDLCGALVKWWQSRPALERCAWCGQKVWVRRDSANPVCSYNCGIDLAHYGKPRCYLTARTDDDDTEIPF